MSRKIIDNLVKENLAKGTSDIPIDKELIPEDLQGYVKDSIDYIKLDTKASSGQNNIISKLMLSYRSMPVDTSTDGIVEITDDGETTEVSIPGPIMKFIKTLLSVQIGPVEEYGKPIIAFVKMILMGYAEFDSAIKISPEMYQNTDSFTIALLTELNHYYELICNEENIELQSWSLVDDNSMRCKLPSFKDLDCNWFYSNGKKSRTYVAFNTEPGWKIVAHKIEAKITRKDNYAILFVKDMDNLRFFNKDNIEVSLQDALDFLPKDNGKFIVKYLDTETKALKELAGDN